MVKEKVIYLSYAFQQAWTQVCHNLGHVYQVIEKLKKKLQ
jgi:hypothetical protein